ncbi:alkaline phosphatase PhoX [Planosporangium flavigriseum]|uniref:alkaline phosphatase PhoX n=1 Tax=Planosporangium flavigriseum TaxID=373681 RepID=UPI001EF2E8E3|nr:alkaline phosphatase PhoX [Planosporangium flavigriseum]
MTFPAGQAYTFTRNELNDSEFAGVVSSPDGKTLFASVQTPGITYAITGPWKRAEAA